MDGINLYYKSYTDSYNFTHSVDMVYIEYFSFLSPKSLVKLFREVHDKFPLVRYEEYLDRKPCSKYDYYLNNIVFGGAHFDIGKYQIYDREKKKFIVLDMLQLRVNPNKHMNEPYFQEILNQLKSHVSSGYIRKYDYAVDIPLSGEYVKVVNSRKERGLYKGTRYYGQAGRHGYVKIYDKRKDLKRNGIEIEHDMTRVEHTLFSNQKESLEDVSVFSPDMLQVDYSTLKDTEKAIVEMYMLLKSNNIDYDLKLGRKMSEKLKTYLHGDSVKIDYSPRLKLLEDIEKDFFCDMACGEPVQNEIPIDSDGFIDLSDDDIKEIEAIFG